MTDVVEIRQGTTIVRMPRHEFFKEQSEPEPSRAEELFMPLLISGARRIVEDNIHLLNEEGSEAYFVKQIAHTLHMMDEQRALCKDLRQSLRGQEHYAWEEIMGIEHRLSVYDERRFTERDHQRQVLAAIEKERRSVAVNHSVLAARL